MNNITLYTTHCPKCNILVSKLKGKNIQYEEVTNVEEIMKLGFMTVPLLKVDDVVMNFLDANNWINERVEE